MILISVLAGILAGSILLLGVMDLVKRIKQRVRVYRVGRELQAMEREAYQAHRGGRT